jgi:hypothetical protein
MERVMTKIAFERWPARLVATALDMNSNVRRARPQPEASDEFKLKKQRQGIAFNLSAKRRLSTRWEGASLTAYRALSRRD